MLPGITTRRATFVVLALVLALGYCGLAFALGEAYPLSPLGMFSSAQTAATRVVARTASGALVEVTELTAWSCPEPLEIQGVCSPLTYSAQDERVLQHLRENRAASGASGASGAASEPAPVELVRLVFRIRGPGAALETETCVLAACSARGPLLDVAPARGQAR